MRLRRLSARGQGKVLANGQVSQSKLLVGAESRRGPSQLGRRLVHCFALLSDAGL